MDNQLIAIDNKVFNISILGSKYSIAIQRFTFNIPADSNTSAGIYKIDDDGNEVLVRTLWSNEQKEAGTYNIIWDRTDDLLNVLENDTYHLQVLSNNVQYVWEGRRIGNTSADLAGSAVHRAFQFIQCAAFTNTTAYYGVNYNEAGPANYKFSLSDIQRRSTVLPVTGTGAFVNNLCTDGEKVYWAGSGFSSNFVYATLCSNDTMYTFSTGENHTSEGINRTYNAISIVENGTELVTGIAVQKTGNLLFVARKNANSLKVHDKISGALLQSFTYSDIKDIAVNESSLYMLRNNVVEKYIVSGGGVFTSLDISVNDFVDARCLAINPDGTIISIIDAGALQQIKSFYTSGLTTAWTLGTLGGYYNSPAVTNYKFYFSDNSGATETGFNPMKPFIAYQLDGSFWVGDAGNYRMQKYTADQVYVDRIMFLNHSYSVAVHKTDYTRVFNEYLEFAIDYTKPIGEGWTLVRNWRGNVTSDYYQDFMVNIFKSCTTLSNGRTYATLDHITTRSIEIVELDNTTGIRYTGERLDPFGSEYFDKEGNITRYTNPGVGEANSAIWKKKTLIGFDPNNNLIHSEYQVIATITPVKGTDPFDYDGSIKGQITANGNLISFDKNSPATTNHSLGYHLGAIKDNKFIWKTGLNTHVDYRGAFPKDLTIDIGNLVKGVGGEIFIIEDNIFFNYKGENWKQSQTNKWNQVHENGLMVGQFGTTGPESPGDAAPEFAGNVSSGGVIRIGNLYYLYHNDEQGAIHRWRITGLETVSIIKIPLDSYVTKNERIGEENTDLLKDLVYGQHLPLTNTIGLEIVDSKGVYNTDEFRFISNVLMYSRRGSKDLAFMSQGADFTEKSGSLSLKRTTTLESWEFTFDLSWSDDSNDNNVASNNYLYIQVLDDDGIEIVRLHFVYYIDFFIFGDYKDLRTTKKFYGGPFSNTEIDNLVVSYPVSYKPDDYKLVKVSYVDNQLIVSYDNNNKTIIPYTSATLTKPESLKIFCTAGSDGRKRSANIKNVQPVRPV